MIDLKVYRKLFDKNAIFMAIISFFSILYAISISKTTNNIDILMKFEGFTFLAVIFSIELAKSTVVEDKVSKRLEFMLANGVSKNEIIRSYFVIIFTTLFIILLPSLCLISINLGFAFSLNFILVNAIYVFILIFKILYTIDMNKINWVQLRFLFMFIIILMISMIIYTSTYIIELYMISKYLILSLILGFYIKRTDIERIIVSFY